MERMMRCEYCAVIQTERSGPQKCQCCGGSLEPYAVPPADQIRAIASSHVERCVVHLLLRGRAGTDKQHLHFVAVARGPSVHGEYPAAISAPVIFGLADPAHTEAARNHLRLLVQGLESQGWQMVAPGKGKNWWAYEFSRPLDTDYDRWEEIGIEVQNVKPTGRDLLRGLRAVFIANRMGRTEQVGALRQVAESAPFPVQALGTGEARQHFHRFVIDLQRDGWQLQGGGPADPRAWWKMRLRREGTIRSQ